MRVVRELWLFFWRDLSIARTYRAPFVIEAIEALFGAALFYYMARFVDSPQLRSSLPPGTSYFAYALVGWIFFEYLHTAIDTFDQSIEQARDGGTLEQLLITQTSLPVMLAGSAIYPFVAALLRVATYIVWGTVLFGFPLRNANWLTVLWCCSRHCSRFRGSGFCPPATCCCSSVAIQGNGYCCLFRTLRAGCCFRRAFFPAGCNSSQG